MSGYTVESEVIASGIYVRVDDGKVPVSVVINHDGRLHIVVHNAMSKAYGGKMGFGKVFANAESALANYKKQSVKDAILIAVDLSNVKKNYIGSIH